eukprot:gene9478-10468_t
MPEAQGKKKSQNGATEQKVPVIYTKFHKKTCNCFHAEYRDNQRRSMGDHNKEALDSGRHGEPWSNKEHVTTAPTNAYGKIEFHGGQGLRKRRAKYVRVSNEDNLDDVVNLLLDEWELRHPKLLISVTGGAKSLKLPDKLIQPFSDGLLNLAKTTNAWVITGGTNTGVMKHVGEALQEVSRETILPANDEERRYVPCIGIASWGIVGHREKLVQTSNTAFEYFMLNSMKKSGAYLDNNHTHFILVDDGTVGKYGIEIEFRSKLENKIMERKEFKKNDHHLPGVLLVLGGGPNTLKQVKEALTQDHPIPVVVINESGGAADWLAFAHDISQEDSTEIKDKLKKEFPKLDEVGLQITSECIKEKEFVCSRESTSPQEQLNLALMLNRADIARSEIFTDDCQLNEKSFYEVMEIALQRNRPNFVELLLEHGFDLKLFLTVEKLEKLYNDRCEKWKNPIKTIFDKESSSECIDIVKKIFTKLTDLNSDNLFERDASQTKKEAFFKNPTNMLFIWAVLNNMQKMALLFWKIGDEPLAKALVACRLYLEMAADEFGLNDDIVKSLKANGEDFKNHAHSLLDTFSSIEDVRSYQLLTCELPNWGNSSCLDLAANKHNSELLAHSCCQKIVADKWTSAFSLRAYRPLKVITCMIIPPLILALHFKRKSEVRKKAYDEKELSGSIVENGHAVDNAMMLVVKSSLAVATPKSENSKPDRALKWWEKIWEFYSAPITKFWGNVLSYLVFLGIFTYVVLGKKTKELQIMEIVLIVFVVSLTTEEIRQLFQSELKQLNGKFHEWSQSKWNICDGIAIVLFYVGLGLRLFTFTIGAGHVIWSIDIMLWIFRLLEIFSFNQHLGPYVLMIGRMVKDLLYFLFIMFVFLFAYGVARQALLHPVSPFSWAAIAGVFFTPYWQTYGELFLHEEHLLTGSKTLFNTKKYNAYAEPIVSILMAFYMLVANILLLNLLIAIFNSTYEDVKAKSDEVWKVQQFFPTRDGRSDIRRFEEECFAELLRKSDSNRAQDKIELASMNLTSILEFLNQNGSDEVDELDTGIFRFIKMKIKAALFTLRRS